MILQRLISEASKLPDLSTEVIESLQSFSALGDKEKIEVTAEVLELMTKITLRPYQIERTRRRTVNLRVIETSIVKAKHAATDNEEDFV
jgi:hypothetical protein